ncbi:Uncharacterised protein [Serratia marcescens]|nr:Uncharacterised protein [Serratia marcescens]CAI0778720.1 Uncharacterised protein [Serratia marcescens]
MIQVVIREKWAKENFSFAAKRLMEREPYCTLCFGATLASPHQLTYFNLFRGYRGGFRYFALSFIPQLLYPSRHGRKTHIHSTGRSCNGVVLIKDQLSGFAFKLCAEISLFH